MVEIKLEYILNVSPKILYNRLATASGLAEWFADDVSFKDKIYTFEWEGYKENAELISKKQLVFVKFKWIDGENEGKVFEFRIENHELSNDLTLIVTDQADEDEKDELINLWETQISKLKTVLGL